MNAQIARFRQYLVYEKGLSPKSVEAYLHDVQLLADFLGEDKIADDGAVGRAQNRDASP